MTIKEATAYISTSVSCPTCFKEIRKTEDSYDYQCKNCKVAWKLILKKVEEE